MKIIVASVFYVVLTYLFSFKLEKRYGNLKIGWLFIATTMYSVIISVSISLYFKNWWYWRKNKLLQRLYHTGDAHKAQVIGLKKLRTHTTGTFDSYGRSIRSKPLWMYPYV